MILKDYYKVNEMGKQYITKVANSETMGQYDGQTIKRHH